MEEIDLNDRLQSDLSYLDREVELLQERIRGRQDVLDRIEDELSAHRERIQQKREEILKTERELADSELKISELKGKYKELFFRRRSLAGDMKVAKEVREKTENMFRKSSSKLQEARERMRKCESQLVLAKERLKSLYGQRAELEDSGFDGKESPLCDVSPVELGRLKERARTLQRELQDYCDADYGVLSEDASLIGRIDYLSEQYDDVKEAKREIDGIIRDTDRQAGLLFKGALKAINDRFNDIFVKLFGGGEANLTLNDEFDLWNSGVEIAARPPGKRPQSLAQLSGGERSLTAIAYLFSTMEEAQVPVAILDEVDASLDEANLRRFADLVEQYSKSLQIVAITHRRLTMERADIMYGVTLEEPGLSKIVSIRLSDWE
jgi:chromosome segregation protein